MNTLPAVLVLICLLVTLLVLTKRAQRAEPNPHLECSMADELESIEWRWPDREAA